MMLRGEVIWEFEKEVSGNYALQVGPKGVPGSVRVPDLSLVVVANLGHALQSLEARATHRVQADIRKALGLKQDT